MVFTGDRQPGVVGVAIEPFNQIATKRMRISSENAWNCAALGEAWVQPTKNSRMSGYRAVRFSNRMSMLVKPASLANL